MQGTAAPSASTDGSSGNGEEIESESEGRYDPAAELTEALSRIEIHTFPNPQADGGTNPRDMQRPMDLHRNHSIVEPSPAAQPRNLPQLQKRMSFATLGQFSSPAGSNARQPASSLPLARPWRLLPRESNIRSHMSC